MISRSLNTIYTKERKFEVGERQTVDLKFDSASPDDLKKFLSITDISTLPDGYIAGWASTETIDHIRDKVVSGAFDKSISERGLSGPRGIKLLIQHDSGKPAGKIEKLEQKSKGLWIEAQLNLNISYVKDMYEAAKMQGGLNFSIGYRLVEGGFKFVDLGPDSYWELSKLDLHEISVVTFPCNDDAVMTFIKGITDDVPPFTTIADFEKALVASNFVKSRNDAQRVTRCLKQLLVPATPEPVLASTKSLDDLANQLAELRGVFNT